MPIALLIEAMIGDKDRFHDLLVLSDRDDGEILDV